MKHRFYLLYLLLSVFTFVSFHTSGEGTKELNNNNQHSTVLYLCTDFAGHCSGTGGVRSQFAVYNGNLSSAETDRLYFQIKDPTEILYLGFKGGNLSANPPKKIVFRIKEKITDAVVFPEQDLPLSGTGFIGTFPQAVNGPNQLLGPPTGYDAMIFTPPYAGIFFIEFAVRNTSTGSYWSGQFDIDIFDLTVASTAPPAAIPGRVFSKGWQFYEGAIPGGDNFFSKNYIISDDSIVTSAEFSNMDGGAWVQYCNQTGCGANNWIVSRKSLNNQQALFPQYKVFLNIPDPAVFPAATTLGQLVAPAPWGERNCNDGHILFHITVDKPGNVEITLTFSAPYTSRSLNQPVVTGENLFDWDGLDGSGTAIPNNSNISFTISYLNGLTNLPLYDVEGNSSGFTIGLVSPPGVTPLVYWDDTNITGPPPGIANFAGCMSPPGCHTWSGSGGGWGDHNTINTWWYNVSTSTLPVSITEFRRPQNLNFNQLPPQDYCAGTNGITFSVAPDPNSDAYVWSFTGTGATINQANAANPFITIDFAANATSGILQVHGTNVNCIAPGPTAQLFITIKPIPALAPPYSKSICSGTSVGVTLASLPAGANFSWSSPSPTCTPNIVACPAGSNSGTQILDVLGVNNTNPGTVTYHVFPMMNGCSGLNQDFIVTVNPLPVPAVAGNNNVCQSSTGNVYTTLPGMSNYLWVVSAGGTVTAGGTAASSSVTVTWNTPGAGSVSLNYTDANGCTAVSSIVFPVTIHPFSVPAVAGSATSCFGLSKTYTTAVGMTNYSWLVSAGGMITAGGSTTDNTVTVLWNTTGSQTVSLNYTDINGCTSLTPTIYNVTVNPLPVPTVSGNASLCEGTAGVIYTTEPGMSNYTWLVPAGGTITAGGTLMDNTVTVTWTTAGVRTVSVNYTNANTCTALLPTVYNVTVNALPNPTLSGTNALCLGSAGVVYATQSGQSAYNWNISAGGIITGGGNAVSSTATVTWNAVGPQWISVNYNNLNGCQAVLPIQYPVTVHPLPVPSISGPLQACALSTGNIYSTQAGMTNYQWIVGPGGTITSGGTTTDPTVTITWTLAGARTVSINYINSDGCTAVTAVSFPVTVFALPIPIITGPAAICQNASSTYTTDPGMTVYSWTVTAGGIITSGQGTSTIDIQWNATGLQSITVNYINGNGCTATVASSHAVTVNVLPVPVISGLSTVCQTNILVYSTAPGMTNYQWVVSAGGTISAGGGLSDASVTVNWTTAGPQTVSVNYTIPATGCTAAIPTNYPVIVKPKPAVANIILNSQQCSGLSTNIILQSTVGGSTYVWTANGSSAAVNGYSASSGPSIIQLLQNTGFNIENVTYGVTPTANGCQGDVTNFVVTVFPVANVLFNPNAMSFCSGGLTAITLSSGVAGSNYTWIATPSSGNITGYSAGSGNFIGQMLTNTGNMIETVIYTATPAANGCTGTQNSTLVTVNPLPVVSYTPCTDIVTTTNAKPFKLKGGLPSGGTYAGAGVFGGIFNPAVAGVGNHMITYAYTNFWGCSGNQIQNIAVINSPAFVCGNPLIDIRDNIQYPTVQIGTQCWMSSNLNFGNPIGSVLMQRDNCVPEKYCSGDNPVNCATMGGLYQWDEMMQYDVTSELQGFCPPGWHIPSENNWNTLFNFYISNGFAGSPLKASGFSGFNANLFGTRFDNVTWSYNNFATFFWSSTSHGIYKAWAHGMNTFNPSVSYYPGNRSNAFSIRCLKD